MCAATLEIITESEGNTARFASKAKAEITQSCVRVSYEIEGDSAELLLSGQEMQMRRQGVCSLRARFVPGGNGIFYVQSNGQTGEIPLRTTQYSFQKKQSVMQAELAYDLQYSTQVQTFYLKISIRFPEEK